MIALNSPNINTQGVFLTPDKKGAWLQTSSGKRVSVLDPQPEEICLNDIVVSLAKQCRFNGHCSRFYSVAQHSVLGASLALELGYSDLVHREFLLHDATEAYLGDLIRPVKVVMPIFEEIEQRFWKVISEKFSLPYLHSPEVHYLDNIMVTWEKRDLLPNSEEWPNLPDISILNLPTMKPWKVGKSERRFYNAINDNFVGLK